MSGPAGREPLPIAGYKPHNEEIIALVNANKQAEEQWLRILGDLQAGTAPIDRRWLAIARTHFEQGFMALNRSILQPERVNLPEDDEAQGEEDSP